MRVYTNYKKMETVKMQAIPTPYVIPSEVFDSLHGKGLLTSMLHEVLKLCTLN